MLLPETICAPRLLKTKQGRLEDDYLRNVNPRWRWSCRGSRAFQERGAVRFRLRIETAVLGPKRIVHALGVPFLDREGGLSLSLVPLKYMLSKITALGRRCWSVDDEERNLLQSLDHLRLL